jgi:hypothetical protein
MDLAIKWRAGRNPAWWRSGGDPLPADCMELNGGQRSACDATEASQLNVVSCELRLSVTLVKLVSLDLQAIR